MKNHKLTSLLFIAALLFINLTSCKKEEIIETVQAVAGKGSLKVELEHVWGMSNSTLFALDTFLVHPKTSDSLKFTKFKYYVSNVKLKMADGSYWIHPESYFLIDLSNPETLDLNFTDIPIGVYTDLEFTLGVDSLRNVSGAQSGALAISNEMFWLWNSGYVMLKTEGTSPQSSDGTFVFHLGGFSGVNNIVTEQSLSLLTTPLTVTANNINMIHMQVNTSKLWHSSPSVSEINKIHMPGENAKNMALSFYNNNAFMIHHVE